MAKVSIIIPVYNTEKYIERCISSLVNQTLKDIEIICVNDGSTDSSGVILQELAQKDKRIKIIDQQNLKQGVARNNGTKIATGEYIGYVDSDDWVDLEFYEKLYNSAKKYDAEIALGTNVRIGKGKTKKRLNLEKEEVFVSIQEKFDVCNQYKNPCPTNKIYKANMLTKYDIVWPEGVYCEDKLFTIKAVYYANKIVTVPEVNYYYYRNPTSTVNSKNKKHLKKINEDKNTAKRAVIKFLKDNNAPIRDKEFWAVKKDIRFFNIPIILIKESLKTERYYLFSVIKIFERTVG